MIAHNDVMLMRANRNQDEVYTPFYAVDLLLEFLPKDKIIWLPFDEEWSAFNQSLSEKGYQVTRSSLKEGKDFFQYEPEQWDILVSNPPFSVKDKVIERAYSFNKPFALLLPIAVIQGKNRHRIFQNDVQLLVPDCRVEFHTNENMQEWSKGIYFGSAYLCRDLLPSKLELRTLHKYQRPLMGGDK